MNGEEIHALWIKRIPRFPTSVTDYWYYSWDRKSFYFDHRYTRARCVVRYATDEGNFVSGPVAILERHAVVSGEPSVIAGHRDEIIAICPMVSHKKFLSWLAEWGRLAMAYAPPPRAVGQGPWFGAELEVEFPSSGALSKAQKEVYDLDLPFDIGYDGSLTCGLEFRSPPAELAAHMDGRVPWDKLCEVLLAHGGKSHDTSTCGLHVHVSRFALRDYEWARAAAFLNHHICHVEMIARRSNNRYCRAYDKGPRISSWKRSRDRYEALNLTPRWTREFRIFRGTLNVKSIRASILFCDLVTKLAKKYAFSRIIALPWERVCEEIVAWEKINPHYSILREYMIARKAWEPQTQEHENNQSEEVQECAS